MRGTELRRFTFQVPFLLLGSVHVAHPAHEPVVLQSNKLPRKGMEKRKVENSSGFLIYSQLFG